MPQLKNAAQLRAAFLIITFLFGGSLCFAQSKKIDSLLILLKTDKEDTNKVKHLYNICSRYRIIGEYDKGFPFGKQALKLAQNLRFKKGEGNSYMSIGLIYDYQGNYPEALKNYFAALKIQEEIKDKRGIAGSCINIGAIYSNQGNHPEALKNYFAALKLFEELKDKQNIAASYNNIGNIYYYQGNYSESLKNYFASLKIKEDIKDKYGIAASYINLGELYTKLNNTKEAMIYLNKGLELCKEMGDKESVSVCFINLGTLYIKENKTKEAETHLKKALQLSKEVGSKDYIKDSYANLAILDSTVGDYKSAFEHHKLFIIYRDSLYNEETKKKSLQASMQYEFDKKEIATKAEQDKLDAISAEEKQKQRVVIYAIAGLLVLVGVFAVFMFNRFRITNRQKLIIEKQKQMVDTAYEELHEKNKEVMDSIRYAKRIQSALITNEKYIENSLARLIKN